MQHVLAVVAAYLIGSVNFGIIVATSRGIDIRSVGSGNPGTSNVLRVLGKKLAAVVLLGDALKGVAAAAIGVAVGEPVFGYVTLAAAVVGHSFPIWHKFMGGKSVATALGGFVYLAPVVGLVLAVIWIALLLIWKTASVASLVSMLLVVPALALAGRETDELLWAGAIALFVIVRHAGNIRDLASRSERTV
ncbi:MAG: glycerol-3-phosphate 1-O-acyltransferase PlsY [Acidimicrobiia bacterium]